MAFSTIPGSAGAPDSYVGTSGVDSITITNGSARAYLTAAAAADFISYNTTFLEPNVLTGAQFYGGQGADTFVDLGSGNNNANFVLLTASEIYGNKDADTIGAPGNGITAVTSSIYGGQGADAINLENVSSSTVNGNKDADVITLNGGLYASSSIYGGQGADTVTLADQGNAAADETYTNTLISLDLDNDSFNVAAAIASFQGSSVLGGQGNDTISAANAGASFIIDGGEGNDALTGSAVSDTISGGGGTDNITGGAGGDAMSAGAGIATINNVAINSTAVALAAAGAFTAAGNYTTANGFDVITGVGAGDIIQVGANNVTANAIIDDLGGAITNLANDTISQIRGNYTTGTGAFAASATGTDTMFAYDQDNAGAFGAIILVGYAGNAGTANINGVITLA